MAAIPPFHDRAACSQGKHSPKGVIDGFHSLHYKAEVLL